MPPIRFGLGDPAQGIAVYADRSSDDLGVESLRELELEHRNDLQFVFPNLIVWAGLGEADRLPDEQQEVEGDVLLGAHIPERPPGQTSEPVEDRHVEEVEREVAAFDRLQECIQGQA